MPRDTVNPIDIHYPFSQRKMTHHLRCLSLMYECDQILHRMQLHSDEVIHVGLYRMSVTTLYIMDRKFTINEKRSVYQ